MPILPAERNVFPRQLVSDFEDAEDFPESEERAWWVLRTKPRQEKSVARQLVGTQAPFYLPLVKKDNLIRGRRVQSHIPLFTGYVFLFGDEDERGVALQTNRVAETLRVVDQPQLWNDLRQVARLLEADAPVTVESRLQPGAKVRVKSGVMKGMEGTVIARRPRSRLLVAVNFLQAGVSLEVGDYVLEPID